MTDGDSREIPSGNWVEKAQWRVAECEVELRGLSGDTDGRRYQKVTQRVERYRELVAHLQAREVEDPADELDALEGELTDLRGRILEAARTLVASRGDWQELKREWGRVADRMMTYREAQGKPAGRVPKLDFHFPAPPAGASTEERAIYDLIRRLEL